MIAPAHGDFGARLMAPDLTQFRLWAPDCRSVSVEIDGVGSFPMMREAEGFFVLDAACGAGTRYRYRVAPDLTVPDPASRAQAGDVHDFSVVVDQAAYRWREPGWVGRPWHEAVIYELHPGASGGFAGIAADLPRLARLGVTAIELMPIADFPGRHNWGYDGVLPYAPDTAYGTPDELKALIDAAHGLRLMVFLDVVYNHFGPDGNHLNAYASAFFREDGHTPWGVAIDFARPQVRRFFIENAIYWVTDYRFDGLRLDAVHAIGDCRFLEELAHDVRASVEPGRQVHLVLENEANDARLLTAGPDGPKFNAQWSDDWHHCLHVLLTHETEGYYEDFRNPAAQLARCLKEGFAYQGEPSAHAGGGPRGTRSADLPSTAFIICLQNHDQVGNRAMGERLSVLARPDALKAAALLLLMTPQIPMLFMGEEWGETRPFLFFTDHRPELAEAVRIGRRQEFARFAAFSDAARREKIPDPNARATFDMSVPVLPRDPTPHEVEILTLYEAGLRLRAGHIAPRIPGAVAIDAVALDKASVMASWRLGDGAVLTIATNLGAEPVACAIPADPLLISTAVPPPSDHQLPGFSTSVWLIQT